MMTTMIRSRFSRTLVAALCLVTLVAITGCSQDRHVFRSTSIAPKSVSLVSIDSGQTVWSMNVPVGQQLFLDFSRKGKGMENWSSPNIPADKVTWELWTLDTTARYGSQMKGGKKLDSETVTLSGEPIIIKVDLLDPSVSSAN